MDAPNLKFHEKHKNVGPHMFLEQFSTRKKQQTPIKILRPNPLAKHDPMLILSLSTFWETVQIDLLVPIEIPLSHEKVIFHFKPSGTYVE